MHFVPLITAGRAALVVHGAASLANRFTRKNSINNSR